MKQRLFVALATVLVFGAGFSAGIWRERHRPLPPPPGLLGIEFGRPRPTSVGAFKRDQPIDRADLVSHIESLRPELDAFKARMAAIDSEFSRELDQVLTPEQRARYEEQRAKRRSAASNGPMNGGPPLTNDQIVALMWDQPARSVLWDVVIPFRLDVLSRDYKLDDAQREKIRALLKARRDKFLALVDSSPPPSVQLSRLAPYVERLAQPAAPLPAPQGEPK